MGRGSDDQDAAVQCIIYIIFVDEGVLFIIIISFRSIMQSVSLSVIVVMKTMALIFSFMCVAGYFHNDMDYGHADDCVDIVPMKCKPRCVRHRSRMRYIFNSFCGGCKHFVDLMVYLTISISI